MKRVSMIFIFLMFFLKLPAPGYASLVIVEGEAVNPFEQLWKANCKVESSGNPFAIGDKNLKSHSYGIVQVRLSRLSDFYNKTGIRYSERDMFDTVKAKRVFMAYCTDLNMERISREWNGGEKGMQKKSTLKYWMKIKKEL
jgi:hypothetical protein